MRWGIDLADLGWSANLDGADVGRPLSARSSSRLGTKLIHYISLGINNISKLSSHYILLRLGVPLSGASGGRSVYRLSRHYCKVSYLYKISRLL